MATGKRIRYYREKLKWTLEDVSSRSGVDVGTISALEIRDSERSKYFETIARTFGLTVEQLSDINTDWLEGSTLAKQKKLGYITFNLLDVEAAIDSGCITPDHPAVLQQINVLESWACSAIGGNLSRIKLITVVGDSMEPTLKNCDVLFVDESVKEYHGDGIYVIAVPDLQVKRLQRLIGGGLRVISDNHKCYPISQDIEGEKLANIIICGKVLAAWVLKHME